MTEQSYGAPSPADRPTTPGATAASGAAVPGAAGSGAAVPGASTGDRPTVPGSVPTIPDGAAPFRPPTSPGRTRTGGAWIGRVLGALVLAFLLVVILGNLDPVRAAFLGFEATLPLGIWLLVAAVAGMLLLAASGLGRMVPRRRAAERTGRVRS